MCVLVDVKIASGKELHSVNERQTLNKSCVRPYPYNNVVTFLRNNHLFKLKIGSVYFLKSD